MGRNDIKLYHQVCLINNLNIVDLVMFNLTNRLNSSDNIKIIEEDEKIQNIFQKLITWS